jgi:hypothetical protein
MPIPIPAADAQLGAGPGGLGDASAAPAPADAFWAAAEAAAVLGCGELPAGLDAGLRGLALGRRATVVVGRRMALREPPAGGWPAAAAALAVARGAPPPRGADATAGPGENPWRVTYQVSIAALESVQRPESAGPRAMQLV